MDNSEVDIVFSESLTGSDLPINRVRCDPDRLTKELNIGAQFGYAKAVVTVNGNSFELRRIEQQSINKTNNQWFSVELCEQLKICLSDSFN